LRHSAIKSLDFKKTFDILAWNEGTPSKEEES